VILYNHNSFIEIKKTDAGVVLKQVGDSHCHSGAVHGAYCVPGL